MTRKRRGATTVEGAITLSVLLLVLLVLFDLGLAAFRYNLLATVARRLARQAAVHGAKASPEKTIWGPAEYSATAADNSEIALAVRPDLATMAGAEVGIAVTWPDSGNHEGNRVRVSVEYRHESLVPLLSLANGLTLRAESTVQIVH